MRSFNYVVKDEVGIHARPAGILAKEVKNYADSKITIRKGDKEAEAKKLMAVMGLGVKCGDEVTVTVDGGDEDAVFEKVKTFFEENF